MRHLKCNLDLSLTLFNLSEFIQVPEIMISLSRTQSTKILLTLTSNNLQLDSRYLETMYYKSSN